MMVWERINKKDTLPQKKKTPQSASKMSFFRLLIFFHEHIKCYFCVELCTGVEYSNMCVAKRNQFFYFSLLFFRSCCSHAPGSRNSICAVSAFLGTSKDIQQRHCKQGKGGTTTYATLTEEGKSESIQK
jgi:hypothetical protein